MAFDPNEIQRYLELMDEGSMVLSRTLNSFVASAKNYVITVFLLVLTATTYVSVRQFINRQDELFDYLIDYWGRQGRIESWQLVRPQLYDSLSNKKVYPLLRDLARKTGVEAVSLYIYPEPRYKLLILSYSNLDTEKPTKDVWILPTVDEGYANQRIRGKLNQCTSNVIPSQNEDWTLLEKQLGLREYKTEISCPFPQAKEWSLVLHSTYVIREEEQNKYYLEAKETAKKLEEILINHD